MALRVSRWPLTAEVRVRSRVSPCEICSGQTGSGTVLLLHNRCASFIIIIIIYMLLVPERETVEPGNLPKSNVLSEIGARWMEKNFHLSEQSAL